MKEEIKKEEEETLLYDELYQNENKILANKIDLNIYNNNTKKSENYKLLNEEDEILLCKEEEIKKIKESKENGDDIKIKELYKGDDNDSIFYLNKNKIRNNLLKNSMEFERNFSNSKFDNYNVEEMDKLYKEVQLKHPRNIIEGEIKKYPFFSWSGFFCCNKKEYLSLGLGYVTYFNSMKLLIIFFLIISLINLCLIKDYSNFKSNYNFNNDWLLQTTIGNTITTYFNTSYFYFDTEDLIAKQESDDKIQTTLNCDNNLIYDIIAVRRFVNVESLNLDIYINTNQTYSKEFYLFDSRFIDFFFPYEKNEFIFNDYVEDLQYALRHFSISKEKKSADLITTYKEYYDYYMDSLFYDIKDNHDKYKNFIDIIYFSCFNITNSNKNEIKEIEGKNRNLKDSVPIITLITLIILTILYIVFKKSISKDNKDYKKNKIFINNYTLVLHKLKILSDDFEKELNDLFNFLEKIIKKNKFLFISNLEEEIDFEIFDVSISNVNEKKIQSFEKIKKLLNKIDDIQNDNDSIKKKIKNNLRGMYLSMHDIAENLTEKETQNIEEENFGDINRINDNNNIRINDILDPNNKTYEEKNNEIEIKKNQINEQKNKITIDIIKLHKEYNLKNYVDIYITFRNQQIPNFIYRIYNKNKSIRFFIIYFAKNQNLKNIIIKTNGLIFI